MKIEERKTVTAPMSAFEPLSKDSSFVEVTEWTNGEGWDITIDDKHISLHYSELAAINYMTAHLLYGDKTNFHDDDR